MIVHINQKERGILMKKEKVTVVDLEKKLLQEDAKILPADITDKLCCIYDCIDNARYKIKTQSEEIYVCAKHSEELRAYTKSNLTAKFFIEKPYNTLRMKIDDCDIYINEVENIDCSELEKKLIEKGIDENKIDRAVIESSVANHENITYAEIINSKLYYINCLPPNDLYFPTSSELLSVKEKIIKGEYNIVEKPTLFFTYKNVYKNFWDDDEFEFKAQEPKKVFAGSCHVCNATASYKIGKYNLCKTHLIQVQQGMIRQFFIDAFTGMLCNVDPSDILFVNFNDKKLKLELYNLGSLAEIHETIKDYKMKFINFNIEFADRFIRCGEIAYSAVIDDIIVTYSCALDVFSNDFITKEEWDEITKRIEKKELIKAI